MGLWDPGTSGFIHLDMSNSESHSESHSEYQVSVEVEEVGLESCGVVDGSIWIIKSALVLFWPQILFLTRTLDQDQDPSLTIVLIKMVLKWEILCNPWIHYLYCSFIFTNLFFCNSFQLCFWENCHLPSFSGTYTLLHTWHQITQTMNDDDCDSWAGVSHILGQTL